MILGLGIDIVEVARIQSSYEKFGRHFLERLLLPPEIEYCLAHKHPAPHIAARFSAKEAVAKAFGTGISAELAWHDMEICRKETGEPYLVLHGPGRQLLATRGGKQVHISLSHTSEHATAVAIIEG